MLSVEVVSAGKLTLIGEKSYEPFVEGNYIVYTNFSDDPFDRDPELISNGLEKGRPVFYHHLPLSNIYLYNISSGETTPIYKSGCRSIIPWIDNDTVFWFEDKRSPVFSDLRDPNPLGFYMYSVPLEAISFDAAEDYRVLNPDIINVNPAVTYNESLRIFPHFSSDSIKVVPDGPDFLMDYTDPSTGNITIITTGHFLDIAYPQLYDDKIFWEDYRSGQSQLFVYDIKTGREYQVAPQEFTQYDCSVDGDIVSWTTYGGELYYTDISGLIEEIPPEETQEKIPKPTEAGAGIVLIPAATLGAFLLSRKTGGNK
ncbi:MAG: hypothetical protein JW931_07340 [Methanomicrobiaceae archaeon]|nr:hypothetical protein [Methanomicrobiaceae archaeon]